MKFIDQTSQNLKDIIAKELGAKPKSNTVNMYLIDLIAQKNKVIPARKFKIEKSKAFERSPYKLKYQDGLKAIERNFRNGISNGPHQSRGTKTDRMDMMLNDWGFYHLHLTDKIENDGFVKRTGPILFCCFSKDTCYFIDILPHGSGHPLVWIDIELMKALKESWPHIFEPLRFKNVTDLAISYSLTEKLDLRKNGINSPIEIDGEIFMAPGMGVSTAKTAIRFTHRASGIIRQLKEIVKICNAKGDFVLDDGIHLSGTLPRKDRYSSRPAILKLRLEGTVLILYEQRSRQMLACADLFCSIVP